MVASGAPTLYYYCANHSGMGNVAYTSQQPTTIDNAGDNIILNGESKNEFRFTLEDETNKGSGTPHILCLDMHQSGLVSIIVLILSLPLAG